MGANLYFGLWSFVFEGGRLAYSALIVASLFCKFVMILVSCAEKIAETKLTKKRK